MKHTDTPWVAGAYGGIFPAVGGSAITLMNHKDGSQRENAKANTEFILRACNTHHEMIEALEACVRLLEDDPSGPSSAMEKAESAIAKAKGETQGYPTPEDDALNNALYDAKVWKDRYERIEKANDAAMKYLEHRQISSAMNALKNP